MKPDEKKFAIAPDGRIVNYDPHHQTLKDGWREATAEDIAAKHEPAAQQTHESVVELTTE